MSKTGCIIQARMTSSRLPGKVLRTIDNESGKTVIDSVVERVKMAKGVDEIIIATTVNSDDDVLEDKAASYDVGCFRGSESDVLSRYYLAAKEAGLDEVIRITSDCPFLDPEIIGSLIDLHKSGGKDYSSNCVRRTYPHGLDCEIVRFDVLEKIFNEQTDKFYREHVTSYITSHYDDFNVGSLESEEDNSGIRITVDTMNDYILTCVLNDLLKGCDDPYSYRTVVELFRTHPYLADINGEIMQKKKYDDPAEEIDAAVRLLKLQEMYRAAKLLEERS